MLRFFLRRVSFGVVVVLSGCFIIYCIMRLVPDTFIMAQAREMSTGPNTLSFEELYYNLLAHYGLDVGIFVGFWGWLTSALRGDFGWSWSWNVPVVDHFRVGIPYSMAINILSFIITVPVWIILGIKAATNQNMKKDYAISAIALMGISLPIFFTANLIRWVFAVNLGWFNLYGIVGRYFPQLSPFRQFLDMAYHLVLPMVAIFIASIGGGMRFMRTMMLDVLRSDYVRTARAKGLSEKKVINSHAFRNTMVPMVTMFSGFIPGLFSGNLMIERIFSIPGVGNSFFVSIQDGDIPFVMFFNFFMLTLTQVSLILADLMYAVVDPRVRAN